MSAVTNVGLQVIEGVANGNTALQLPSMRNVGFIGASVRGPVNVAIPFNSNAGWRSIFGGFDRTKYMPTLVRNFYNNTSGYTASCYCVRVVGTGTVNGSGSVVAGGATMVTIPAYQGSPSPGDWSNGTLSTILYAFNTLARNAWLLQVVYNGTVVETYTAATCAAITTAMRNQSNYALTTWTAEPTTTVAGQTGTGTITDATVTNAAVLATASNAVTVPGSAGATITAKALTGGSPIVLGSYTVQVSDTNTLVAAGLVAAITGGSTGFTAANTAGAFTITAPTGSNATGNTYILEITTTGATTVTSPTVDFAGGLDPVYSPTATVTGTGTAFTTQLQVGSQLMNSAGTVIGIVQAIASNTSLTLSAVPVTIVVGAAFTYNYYNSVTVNTSGGVYVAPVESDFYGVADPVNPKGLNCFDGVDVQLILCTEFNTLTMAEQGSNYCANRKDALYIVNMPQNAPASVLLQWADALQVDTISYIAVYNCWINTSDEGSGFVWVPAIGAILGAAFIRTAAIAGNYIHIPPGGVNSALTDYQNVTPATLDPTVINTYTRDYTINSVVFQKGIGYFVIASRTMSTNPLYNSIHIRMQASYYVRVATNNYGWVIQAPNTPSLKRDLITSITQFFKQEYANGSLEQSVPFATACVIICDQTNNPIGQDRKQLNAEVDYIPTEVAE